MISTAFARARKFLDYHPVAQWSAIISSIAAAVLFFLLFLLFALFADLAVNRGEVPALWQLTAERESAFASDAALSEDQNEGKTQRERVHNTLQTLGRPDSDLAAWFASERMEALPYRERELLWYVTVVQHLGDAVGEDASGRVAERLRSNIAARGLEAAISQPLDDCGILGAVERRRGTPTGWLLASVASWNSWMWAGGDTTYLVWLFVLALIVTVVRVGLLFVAHYTAAMACIEAVTRLRRAVYLHTYRLGPLPFQEHRPKEAVEASNRHLEVVQDGLYRWLTVFFREPAKAVLLLAMALFVSPWLAVAFLMFALLVWLVGGQVASLVRRQGRAAQKRALHQLTLIQESLLLTRLVKVCLMEPFNQKRVEQQLRTWSDAQLARYRGEAIYRPLFAMLGFLAALVLLLAAGFVIVQGHLGVAGAAVLAAALVALYWPVRAMLETRRSLRRGRDAARALFAFLDRSGGVGQAIEAEFVPALSTAIEVDKVTVQEPNSGRKLLRGITLRIEAGQRIALVGPDALEKQAFISLLPRFIDPTAGEVRLDGKNLRWVTLDSLRTQMALVLQDNLVFSDTVANNIGCGEAAYNLQRIIDAAKIAHAHQFIQKLPQGYETVIGEGGHALSVGEMYRIALARALVREPALFIIEEPAVPLDDDTKDLIDDTMQRILPGRTVVFLPNRLSTIRNCDQVLVLYQGRIVATGDHRELLATSDLYKHLQYLQFNEFAAAPVAG
jgi:ATP-binding cassette subfamily B protein